MSHRDTLNIYSGGLSTGPPRFEVKMYKDIERMLRNIKVEDDHIILDKPYEYTIYGIEIIVDQVNYYYDWDKFSYWLGIFLNGYANVSEVFKLPDGVDDLKTFRENICVVLNNNRWGRKVFKSLVKLCKLTTKCDIKQMKKKFKLDDWVELFLWVYVYNILGVKKNLRNALKVVTKVQSI
jgi:hypothetical protein